MKFGFSGNDKFIVGYDLNDDFCQISYFHGESNQAECIPSVVGSENYSIPMVLCKRVGVNQWFFGREALRYGQENEGILVDHLWSMALDGEPVYIDGVQYNPLALFALFFKRSLSLLTPICGREPIYSMMITCQSLDGRAMEVLEQTIRSLKMKNTQFFFQDHGESFFSYMKQQPQELWEKKSILFDCRETGIWSYTMEPNYKTKPVVVFVNQKQEDEKELSSFDSPEAYDQYLYLLCQSTMNGANFSSVYLVGEHMKEEALSTTLHYVCRGRRVFLGNNLFCKGACLSLMDKYRPEEQRSVVYLGRDKLRYNIGLTISNQGKAAYLPLLDAGENWYEVEASRELYLKGGQGFFLNITSLIGNESYCQWVELEGLHGELNRLWIELSMLQENKLLLQVQNFGLGNSQTTGNMNWEKEILVEERSLSNHRNNNIYLPMGKRTMSPYILPGTELFIYSLEELCYRLMENAYILDASIMNTDLIHWLEKECELKALAESLEPLATRRGSLSGFVTAIMKYAGIYSDRELEEFVRILKSTAGLSILERRKQQIDADLANKRFVPAIRGYDLLARQWESSEKDGRNALELELMAEVYYNKGVAYSHLMLYDVAAECFLKSYHLSGQKKAYVSFFASKRMALSETEYVSLIANEMEHYPWTLELEKELESIRRDFAFQDKAVKLKKCREARENGETQQYLEEATDTLKNLKAIYREYVLDEFSTTVCH